MNQEPSHAATRAAEAISPTGAIQAWIYKQADVIERETGIGEACEIIKKMDQAITHLLVDEFGKKGATLASACPAVIQARAFLEQHSSK